MDNFFVPFVSVYIDHFPVKVQVENFQKVLMHVPCGGAKLRLDSVLKPKNTENSTKKLPILEQQKKLSNFTMDKVFPLWFDNPFFGAEPSFLKGDTAVHDYYMYGSLQRPFSLYRNII
jgi:hypothetical protein